MSGSSKKPRPQSRAINIVRWEIAREELLAARAERSPMEFARQAWHILEPRKRTLQENWHLDAISEHLVACSEGYIPKIIFNVPPGFMKSMMVSVFWNAWEWTRWPWTRWLAASYAQPLATRDAVKVRRILESDWYRLRVGHLFGLCPVGTRKHRLADTPHG